MEINAHWGEIFTSTKINRNVERKNKSWKWGEKREREKKRKRKHTQKGGGKNRCLIFLLSVGDKREILKLIFNTINCLMKHNNLSG